jgi:mycothiol synthase
MVSVRVLRPPAPEDIEIIRSLEAAAAGHDGHESLGSFVWRDLADPSPESIGYLATDDRQAVGYLHLAPSDNVKAPHLVAGLVIDPDHRTDAVARALLGVIVLEVAGRGGGRVVLWVNGADADLAARLTAAGFRWFSEQLQMRVPLPPAESPKWPVGIEARAFVPGQDDADWLRVNNRAFADHPDQGGWSDETLAKRMAEPWFDPPGFLLAFAGPSLAGFCWTKVHDAAGDDPRLGEIYVIGVDPDHQGTGLGRALTVAGLEYLAKVRDCPTGMLYVDGSNTEALALYRALGFQMHRADRAYELDVAP